MSRRFDGLFENCISSPDAQNNEGQCDGDQEVQPHPTRHNRPCALRFKVSKRSTEERSDECTREKNEGYGRDDIDVRGIAVIDLVVALLESCVDLHHILSSITCLKSRVTLTICVIAWLVSLIDSILILKCLHLNPIMSNLV